MSRRREADRLTIIRGGRRSPLCLFARVSRLRPGAHPALHLRLRISAARIGVRHGEPRPRHHRCTPGPVRLSTLGGPGAGCSAPSATRCAVAGDTLRRSSPNGSRATYRMGISPICPDTTAPKQSEVNASAPTVSAVQVRVARGRPSHAVAVLNAHAQPDSVEAMTNRHDPQR
jgi:hypothetical protein